MPVWFWFALAGFAGAVFLLSMAARADCRNWIIERATPLPIGLLNPRDDVWIAGEVDCACPLTVPNFGRSCVYYSYKEEQRVERTRMVNGRPMRYRTWETRHTEARRVDFDLVQKTGRITVRADQARFDGTSVCGPMEYDWDRRRSAVYFPYPAHAGAVGSVSDDRRRLEEFANIPLCVTTRERAEFVASLEQSESWFRRGGAILLFVSLLAILLGLSLYFGIPPVLEKGIITRSLLLSAAGALAIFLVWLTGFLYNQLILYRERVKTAWRQIDVDLKNRHDLIPQLVRVIEGYQEHEAGLLSALADLRNQPGRDGLVDVQTPGLKPLPDLVAVAERYPELKANQLFTQLRDQLTALEEKIAFGREFYNDSILEYDNSRERFPTRIVAWLFPRFPIYERFEIENDEGQPKNEKEE